jgi:guanylate kinase
VRKDGRGTIVVVSGPAGVGKTTVCTHLLATGEFVPSVSVTTRKPRGQEQDGVDYHFIDVPEFERLRAADELLEWARVHETTYYGTPKKPVLAAVSTGKHIILNIDVQGAAQLRKAGHPLVTIFLLPPSFEQLRERLARRGDTPQAEIERRMRVARDEIAQSNRYDLRLVNDKVERVTAAILAHLEGGPAPQDEGDRLGLAPRAQQA